MDLITLNKYPHPAITTDCVIFAYNGESLNVLLIQRGFEPYKGDWAFPGGFLNMDETVEEGARRELREETGLDNIVVEQLQVFSDVNRDPRERVITVAHYALINQSDYEPVKGGDDAGDAKWFSIDKLPLLAFDHDRMFQVALNRLCMKLRLIINGFSPNNLGMRMSDIRRIHEMVSAFNTDSNC